MNIKLKHLFIIFSILLFAIQVQADAPINYNKELASDVELRGTFFTDDNADGFYVSLIGENSIQIDSDIHHVDKTIKIKKTALDSRFKKFNGINIGITHISDNGIVNNYISPVVIDGEFVYLTVDFSTIIINGMTGTTTTTLTGLSGNQSISVPNGNSYDLNITNNQEGVWASSDGRNYQNKSIITINGSMVTTESQIPLQLFTNLEGVNGTGDIGIAYTNLTAIPRDVEYVWDSDNVSIHFTFNTISSVDSQFVVLWGSDNNIEPAADSTYGKNNVWSYGNYTGVWHMNNNVSSENLIDSSSSGYNGVPSGFVSSDFKDADYGKGISSNDVDEIINIDNPTTLLDANSGTIIMRIRVDDLELYTRIITSSNAGIAYPNGDEFAIDYRGDFADNYARFILINGGSVVTNVNTENNIFPDSTNFHTVIIRCDGTNPNQWIQDGVSKTIGSTTSFFADAVDSDTFSMFGIKREINYYDSKITLSQVYFSTTTFSTNYDLTLHKNLHNPTATGADPFYKSIGTTETASLTTNITASVTGGNNTQSYNTSESREFTLTPTGATNDVLVNTTSTDYDVTVTTYWTEDTTLQSETVTAGYTKQHINYTPSFNTTSADLNTTFTFNFSEQDYIGTATSTLNDVSKTTTRDGQDINASVGGLIKNNSYWWNVTVPYNNIFTLSNQSDTSAYLGVSKQFTDSIYNDPDNNPILSRLWNFGDSNNLSTSNPIHTYTSLGVFNANYTVTENATTNNQTITKEFNVSVEVQPPQNVTTVPHQTNVSIDWDDYTSADKYSVYELEDGFPYVDTDPVIDGVKDAIYDYAHEFLIFSPNPVNPGDYETSYPVRTSLGAYFFHEAVDNDDKLGDDDLIYYFDLDNDGLTVDDPAWKITNNIVKKYLWNGGSWQVTGVSDAVGASTGGSTHYPKHELFIPIAELGANWTNGSTVKVLVKREDSSLTPDVITWYPYGNINDTDTNLWQEMVLNDPESYTWLANVTLSNYTALNLTPFTIYHGAVSSWNGTDESDYTLFDVITEDIPVYNVSGYVFDDLGNIIAGAIVYSCNGFVHEITQTDIYGYWIGYNFREGNYTICANKSGYADNSIDIYVSTNLTNQNITLPAFEMTDWMLWEKLLEIEDAIDDLSTDFTPTEGNYEMLSSTYNIFLLLLGACFILAFPKRGEVTERDTGLNNVLFSFLGTILAMFLAQIIVSGQVVESFAFESQIYDPLQHYFLYLIAVIMFVVFALNAVYYVRQRVD